MYILGGVKIVASNYKNPRTYIRWQIEGTRFAILQYLSDEGTTETAIGRYKAIDETLSKAAMIIYESRPASVTKDTDVPEIDKSLHVPLVDYVKSKLIKDNIAKGLLSDSPESGMVLMTLSRDWERAWNRALTLYVTNRADKTGGTRSVVLPKV